MKFIEPAPVIFAIGSKADIAWVRPYDQKNFADIDAAIVTTQMMLAIHDLGYGSTWIGHFDAVSLKKLFPEMEDYELIALLPVGIMAEDGQGALMRLVTEVYHEAESYHDTNGSV